jgi:hypothetical protein
MDELPPFCGLKLAEKVQKNAAKHIGLCGYPTTTSGTSGRIISFRRKKVKNFYSKKNPVFPVPVPAGAARGERVTAFSRDDPRDNRLDFSVRLYYPRSRPKRDLGKDVFLLNAARKFPTRSLDP